MSAYSINISITIYGGSARPPYDNMKIVFKYCNRIYVGRYNFCEDYVYITGGRIPFHSVQCWISETELLNKI